MEKGDVPGEWYSPTQPFPTAPPAYENQGVDESMLIDFTPELHKEALEIVKHYKMGPIFTPPVVSKAEGPWGTLAASLSGSNWMGGSIDPETGVVYVGSGRSALSIGLVPSGDRSDVGYISGRAPGVQGQLTVKGLPLLKPPYAQISAIDLKTGTILWHVPHGDTPDNVRNNPALKGVNIPQYGARRSGDYAGDQDVGHRRREGHGHACRTDARAQCFGPTIRRPGRMQARCTCRRSPRAVP